MEKQYFKILLEEMRSNFKRLFECFEAVYRRLDRLEAGQAAIKSDLQDIKRIKSPIY